MPPNAVRALLSRIANDASFRDWLEQAPEEALAGYALSHNEARLFTEGGTAAAALLSWEARGENRPKPSTAARPAEPPPAHSALPPADFILQITPTPQAGPDGQVHLAHLAGLHPGGADPASLQGACFSIRLSPLATPQTDGSLQVHYTATIDPIEANAAGDSAPDTAVPTAPWGHDLSSAEVLQAAEAVHAAAPAERHAAILTLIEAMTP